MEMAIGDDEAQSGLFQEFQLLLQKLLVETPQQLGQVFSSKTLLSFLHFVSVLRELVSSSSLGKAKLPSPWFPRRRKNWSPQSRRRRRTKTCQPASGRSPGTGTQVMNLQSLQPFSQLISELEI